MIACIDVAYHEPNTGPSVGVAACLVFENWQSEKVTSQYVTSVSPIADYVPGKFYLRELPPILEVLNIVEEEIDIVVVDGYVQLGTGRPGLGEKLFEAFDKNVTVVGVAKKSFANNDVAIKVLRGTSLRPLYVTAIGMTIKDAAKEIKAMSGANREPKLLKQVDRVVRDEIEKLK